MFALHAEPIDALALRAALAHDSAGAVAVFEGVVRNHNQGRSVRGLRYEAYPELALREGERIVDAARRRHPVDAVICVHRIGTLQVGELAVWVGVAAAHRDAAFAACREVIDAVKAQVPIWKHEDYVDGAGEWLHPA
jgi:molybdopterin synthase catalytic subunit